MFKRFRPVIENVVQLPRDVPAHKRLCCSRERQDIVYRIRHEHSSVGLFEMVLVVPEGIRSLPLFVHKEKRLFNMGYFSYPPNRQSGERVDLILYHHPFIHSVRNF